jgi:2'-5' RNA ligase
MPNLVIVALPAEDDIVNKISSEEAAHMTLLFLGDASKVPNLAPILDFVRHAASISLSRFGMEVDHRGVLGVDQADCLFFSKSKWSGFDEINQFRSNLLKQTDIRNAYDSTAQFPEFVPHMTLGYPEAPANPDTRDYPGIHYVLFDRIAVWNQEFSGIEFPLKAYDSSVDVAMSGQGNTTVRSSRKERQGGGDISESLVELGVDFLEHHGIKGMKWGVRRAEKRIAKGDRSFEKQAASVHTWVRLHNAGAEHFNTRIDALNDKPKFKKASDEGILLDMSKPVTRQYHKEATDIYLQGIRAEAAKMGQNPSGTKKIGIGSSEPHTFYVTLEDIKHENLFKVIFDYDDQGRIIGLHTDELTQGAMVVGDILEHHGVKGMKWGIRKNVHPDIAHIPHGTRKAAQRDAAEHTRAAMFFGEGAGTRRKLIKARVEARKKKDPLYAEAFDHFVKQTNMDKRASQARRERRRKDNSKMAGRLLKDVLLAQSGLEHHGVKGMKWGVRRASLGDVRTVARKKAGLAGPQEVRLKDKRKKVTTSGGQGHPAHEDAVSARTIGQRGKASGLKSLSNKELEQYAKRLQLEANVNRLNYGEKSAGSKFVADLLNKNGKAALTSGSEQAASAGAKKAINSKLGRKVARKAATVAAAAALA